MNPKTRVGLIFFLVLIFLSVVSRRSQAEEWRPKNQQFKVQEARQDCSVIKAVFLKTQQTFERRAVDLKELTRSTKSSYESLKECQKKNGIGPSDSLDANSKTADLCAETFDFWVLEGAHLTVAEEDMQKLQEELSTLKSAVGRKCLPTLVAELN